MLEIFTRGLVDAGHTFELADLYRMGFESEMKIEQYKREVGLDPLLPVPEDVSAEHRKIDVADALAFIYPVWWSDCPAKLKGWFDRVMTYGYAYYYDESETRHSTVEIEKAVVICSAGHTNEHLEETGIAESMRKIMIEDRLLGIGVKSASMLILGGMMPKDDTFREENLKKAYDLGHNMTRMT